MLAVNVENSMKSKGSRSWTYQRGISLNLSCYVHGTHEWSLLGRGPAIGATQITGIRAFERLSRCGERPGFFYFIPPSTHSVT